MCESSQLGVNTWIRIFERVMRVSYDVVLCEFGNLRKKNWAMEATLLYQSQVSILGPVGYGPTTLPLRHSDLLIYVSIIKYIYHRFNEKCMI